MSSAIHETPYVCDYCGENMIFCPCRAVIHWDKMDCPHCGTRPTFLTAPSGYARDKRTFRYRPMTIAEAKALPWYGEQHALSHNGVIRRVRPNGAVKTWKRDATRIEVPLKYGMYDAFRDTSHNGQTMAHLIVLLDASGSPTNDESAATVQEVTS